MKAAAPPPPSEDWGSGNTDAGVPDGAVVAN